MKDSLLDFFWEAIGKVDQWICSILLIKNNSLKQWSKEVRSWTTKEPHAFWGVIVLVESTCVCIWAWSSDWILYWGVFLQVLGIAVAIHNLLKIRATCNQVPLKKRFKNWINGFPRLDKQPTEVNVSMEASGPIISCLIQNYDLKEEESIEMKVKRLDRELDSLKTEFSRKNTEIEEIKVDIEKMKVTEEKARETMRTEIRNEIEHLFTQDIIGSLVGLVLVMYGVLLSTLADLIFNL